MLAWPTLLTLVESHSYRLVSSLPCLSGSTSSISCDAAAGLSFKVSRQFRENNVAGKHNLPSTASSNLPHLQRLGRRDAFRGRETLMIALRTVIPRPLEAQPLVPTHTG